MQTEAIFDGIADRIYLEIEKAQSSIYIAVAWFTNKKLFNVMLKKAQQGVIVQLMLSNDHINQQSHIEYNQLDIGSSGAYLIGDGKQDLMHNKFCIIDNDTVINGSYNWSYKAEKNHENILITKGDQVLADQFIKQFKKIRNIYFDHQEDNPELPLDKIIKRLEIIKNYVVLEDIEDIARENGKLKVYAFQQDIAAITQALQQHSFETAITLIDLFIKNHHALVIYNDIDISALKLEIRQLEHQLNAYDNEKIELEQLCSEFYHRHTQELGSYIKRLLELRKISTEDDPEEYAEAVKDEQDYNEQFELESEKEIYQLDDEQRLEIKKAYRQASQICHPDRVNENMKDIAQEIFIKLNEAYKKNDVDEVKQILSELRQDIFKPRSETVSESDQLKVIIKMLKHKIKNLEDEIFMIKGSEDYQTIHSIEDWNSYFEDVKAQLIEEIDYLEADMCLVDDGIVLGKPFLILP
ncbi:phospholipase D-like domain-containing protein [Psychrobacter sp. AOP22-C1-C5]|uniref:phospholipase D-like domain-containing protein n=1 Tax=Psychrobacter sp. AOP22-C1-C5 TaxID=3457716 RepID=UPI0040357B6F